RRGTNKTSLTIEDHFFKYMATFVIKLSTYSNHRGLIHVVVEKEDGNNHISLKLHTSYIRHRPYLTQYATQLLVQTLVNSALDYCTPLLTGLPACVVKPLQMIQNAAARLVFNQPKRAHVTPLLIELHWLPVAARIKF